MIEKKIIKITLIRSSIGQKLRARATVRSLGLRKINSSVNQEANPSVLGMIRAVSHLVTMREVN